jgi:hypothetical protein
MSTGSVAASLFLSGWAQQRFSSNSILFAALFAAYLALTAQRNRPFNERLFAGKKNSSHVSFLLEHGSYLSIESGTQKKL